MITLAVGVGAVIAIGSAAFWRKFWPLHFAPWLFGFFLYFLTFDARVGFQIVPPLVMGFAFYVMAWASAPKNTKIFKRREHFITGERG